MRVLVILIGFPLIVIGIPVAIFFAIKHLIKFTAHTIYEEKAKAEERHRRDYNPGEDR
jgi:hypothetical protein